MQGLVVAGQLDRVRVEEGPARPAPGWSGPPRAAGWTRNAAAPGVYAAGSWAAAAGTSRSPYGRARTSRRLERVAEPVAPGGRGTGRRPSMAVGSRRHLLRLLVRAALATGGGLGGGQGGLGLGRAGSPPGPRDRRAAGPGPRWPRGRRWSPASGRGSRRPAESVTSVRAGSISQVSGRLPAAAPNRTADRPGARRRPARTTRLAGRRSSRRRRTRSRRGAAPPGRSSPAVSVPPTRGRKVRARPSAVGALVPASVALRPRACTPNQ